MQYAFISDLHGDADSLRALHTKFMIEPDFDENTQLVLLGDYTDGRNADNKRTIELIMQMVSGELPFHHKPIFLIGNHDLFMLYSAQKGSAGKIALGEWRNNGGNNTLRQLGYVHQTDVPTFLRDEYGDYIDWLATLPFEYETDLFYAVHAGLDMTLPDPRETSPIDKVWVREKFYDEPNRLGKTMVSGHTPTQLLGGSGDTIMLAGKKDEPIRFLIDGGVKSQLNKKVFPNLLILNDNGRVVSEKLLYHYEKHTK